MFSKVAPDPEVSGREKYRAPRPECAGLKISRPELDPATFRSLISCFGANGSIPEISKLVSGASDSTLVETVDLLNTAFLTNAGIRTESRTIVRSFQERGRWEPVLAGLAPMFKDPERTRALFRLLSLGERDPLVIKTVQGFDPENTGAGLELLSRVVKSKAFGSLLRKIKAQPLSESERDRLLTLLTHFLRRQTQYRSADALVTDLAAGRGASIWNFAFGEGSTLLDTTSRFTLLLRDFSGPDGIRRIGRFHRGFHHPISCWGGGKVFAEPWKNLTDELKTHATEGTPSLQAFVTRFATVTALGIRDLCEIPEEYFEHYPAVARFTAGRTGGSYIGLLEKIFIGGMGESAGYFVGEWGESLADALGILEPKPWFGDLVLLFAELDEELRRICVDEIESRPFEITFHEI